VYPTTPEFPRGPPYAALGGSLQLPAAPAPYSSSGVPGLRRPGHPTQCLPSRGPRDTKHPHLPFHTASTNAAELPDRFQCVAPTRQHLAVNSNSLNCILSISLPGINPGSPDLAQTVPSGLAGPGPVPSRKPDQSKRGGDS